MDWVADTEGVSHTAAWQTLRELGPRCTARGGKILEEAQQKSHACDLKAFAGEEADPEVQLSAYNHVWRHTRSKLEAITQQAITPTISTLLHWAAQQTLHPATATSTTQASAASSSHPAAPPPAAGGAPITPAGPYDSRSSSRGAQQHQQQPGSLVPSRGAQQQQQQQPGSLLPSCALGDAAVPAALVSTVGLSGTEVFYSSLQQQLQQQGHPVAVLEPSSLAALPTALRTALRQWAALPTSSPAGEDTAALVAWWADHCRTWHQQAAAAAVKAAGARRRARLGLRSAAAADGEGDGTAAEGGAGGGAEDAAAAAAARAALTGLQASAAATPAAKMRPGAPAAAATPAVGSSTPAPAAAGAGGHTPTAGVHTPAPGKRGGSLRPLLPPMLVVRDAEQVDVMALTALVQALQEERAGLPVVLVLGVHLGLPLYQRLLPGPLVRLTRQLGLQLPSSEQHLGALYRYVLLAGPLPSYLLSRPAAAWLHSQFKHCSNSCTALQQALQLGAMSLAMEQPLACVAPAVMRGSLKSLVKAVNLLPRQQLAACSDELRLEQAAGGRQHVEDLVVGRVWETMQSAAQWRLAVLLLEAVAAATGAAEVDPGCQLPGLYAAASSSGFLLPQGGGRPSPLQHLLTLLAGSSSTPAAAGGGRSRGAAGAASSSRGKAPAAGHAANSNSSGRFLGVRGFSPEVCQQLLQQLLKLVEQGGRYGPKARHSSSAVHGTASDSDRSSSSDSDDSSSDTSNSSSSDESEQEGGEGGRREQQGRGHKAKGSFVNSSRKAVGRRLARSGGDGDGHSDSDTADQETPAPRRRGRPPKRTPAPTAAAKKGGGWSSHSTAAGAIDAMLCSNSSGGGSESESECVIDLMQDSDADQQPGKGDKGAGQAAARATKTARAKTPAAAAAAGDGEEEEDAAEEQGPAAARSSRKQVATKAAGGTPQPAAAGAKRRDRAAAATAAEDGAQDGPGDAVNGEQQQEQEDKEARRAQKQQQRRDRRAAQLARDQVLLSCARVQQLQRELQQLLAEVTAGEGRSGGAGNRFGSYHTSRVEAAEVSPGNTVAAAGDDVVAGEWQMPPAAAAAMQQHLDRLQQQQQQQRQLLEAAGAPGGVTPLTNRFRSQLQVQGTPGCKTPPAGTGVKSRRARKVSRGVLDMDACDGEDEGQEEADVLAGLLPPAHVAAAAAVAGLPVTPGVTPGGLTSALRKQVRFADSSPAAAATMRELPLGAGATPLSSRRRVAPAAAPAAAAGSSKKGGKKKALSKHEQAAQEGQLGAETGSTSTAVMAALAASKGLQVVGTNARATRLVQLMAAAQQKGKGATAAAAATQAAAAAAQEGKRAAAGKVAAVGGGSPEAQDPAAAEQRSPSSSKRPAAAAADGGGGGAGSGAPERLLSPSKRLKAAAAAAAAAAGGDSAQRSGGGLFADEVQEVPAATTATAAAAAAAARALSGTPKQRPKLSLDLTSLPAAAAGGGGGEGGGSPLEGLLLSPRGKRGSSRRQPPQQQLLSPTTPPRAAAAAAAAAGDMDGVEDMLMTPRSTGKRQQGSGLEVLLSPGAAAAGWAAAAAATAGLTPGAMPASSRKPERVPSPASPAAAADGAGEVGAGGRGASRSAARQVEPHTTTHSSKGGATPAADVAGRLADLLCAAVPVLMAPWVLAPPPAAAALLWGDLPQLSSTLAPHPQQALVGALSAPWQLLGSCSQQVGPGWEDPCVAYKLLEQQGGGPRGEGLGIAEWFGLFCSALGMPVGAGGEEEEEGGELEGGRGASRRKRRADMTKRARMYGDVDRGATAAAAGDTSDEGDASDGSEDVGTKQADQLRKAGPSKAAKKGGAAAGAAAAGVPQLAEGVLLEAAARFCQATAELQFLGVWRPVKRQRSAAAALNVVG